MNKNMSLIYAATDAAAEFSRTASRISLLLSRYLDVSDEALAEKIVTEQIRNEIANCADFATQMFDAILEDGINHKVNSSLRRVYIEYTSSKLNTKKLLTIWI